MSTKTTPRRGAKTPATSANGTGPQSFVVIPRKAQPSKAASTDKTRPSLTRGHLRKRDKGWEILTTDSYGLARLPVHVEGGADPTEGPIPAAALRHAEKTGAFRITAEGVEPCNRHGASEGVLYRHEPEAKAPAWDQILDRPREKTFTVALNTKILRRVAEAIGTDSVRLEVDPTDALSPISVRAMRGNEGDGVVMPIRIA